jgi:hypothetical protein
MKSYFTKSIKNEKYLFYCLFLKILKLFVSMKKRNLFRT